MHSWKKVGMEKFGNGLAAGESSSAAAMCADPSKEFAGRPVSGAPRAAACPDSGSAHLP